MKWKALTVFFCRWYWNRKYHRNVWRISHWKNTALSHHGSDMSGNARGHTLSLLINMSKIQLWEFDNSSWWYMVSTLWDTFHSALYCYLPNISQATCHSILGDYLNLVYKTRKLLWPLKLVSDDIFLYVLVWTSQLVQSKNWKYWSLVGAISCLV